MLTQFGLVQTMDLFLESRYDFYIRNNYISSSNGTTTPSSYECDEKCGLTGGQINFNVKEMEVFILNFCKYFYFYLLYF